MLEYNINYSYLSFNLDIFHPSHILLNENKSLKVQNKCIYFVYISFDSMQYSGFQLKKLLLILGIQLNLVL